MGKSIYQELKVKSVITETNDSKSLVLEVPQSLSESFKYKPGQFLTFRLPVSGQSLLRCYSMSSTPKLDDFLRVTVKRVVNGRASNWLCDNVKAEDKLEVMVPGGNFAPSSLQGDFIFCAGGSGITPIFSILRSVLSNGKGKIRMIYANRDEKSVIFAEQLKELSSKYPERLQIIHWLDSVQGIPSVPQLVELAKPFKKSQAYVCGPGPFMDGMVSALETIEMKDDNIHVERFISLPDEEEQADKIIATPIAEKVVDSAELEIELDGSTHKINWPGTETLLDTALSAGIEVPYSCKSGICGSCMCKVDEGKVIMRKNEALDERALAKNYTLTCQAIPQTNSVRVRFPG